MNEINMDCLPITDISGFQWPCMFIDDIQYTVFGLHDDELSTPLISYLTERPECLVQQPVVWNIYDDDGSVRQVKEVLELIELRSIPLLLCRLDPDLVDDADAKAKLLKHRAVCSAILQQEMGDHPLVQAVEKELGVKKPQPEIC